MGLYSRANTSRKLLTDCFNVDCEGDILSRSKRKIMKPLRLRRAVWSCTRKSASDNAKKRCSQADAYSWRTTKPIAPQRSLLTKGKFQEKSGRSPPGWHVKSRHSPCPPPIALFSRNKIAKRYISASIIPDTCLSTMTPRRSMFRYFA